MKKIILIITIIITILILKDTNLTISTVIKCNNFFIKNIFPTLFPFFIISELLINYGFIKITSKLFKPIMKIFKINPNCSFILVISMISGFPSSAKITKDLYLKKQINSLEASKILMFTHFSNPLFILGTISILLNKKLALLILIIHYITNFIVGFLLRNLIDTSYTKKSMNEEIKTKPFIITLKDAINSSFDTLFLILGLIIIFSLIGNIMIKYIPLNSFNKMLVSGLLEMTNGIYNISYLNISLKIKSILIGMILSFGGICIHMQIKSIISDTSIKYQPYLIARLLHSAITGILIYLFYEII